MVWSQPFFEHFSLIKTILGKETDKDYFLYHNLLANRSSLPKNDGVMIGENLKKLLKLPVRGNLNNRLGGGIPLRVQSHKNLLLTVLILLLSASSLCARGSLKWTWYSQDEKVSYYRYQLDTEEENNWTIVDSSVTTVTLPKTELNTLYVQASYDGVIWSTSTPLFLPVPWPTLTTKKPASPHTLAPDLVFPML